MEAILVEILNAVEAAVEASGWPVVSVLEVIEAADRAGEVTRAALEELSWRGLLELRAYPGGGRPTRRESELCPVGSAGEPLVLARVIRTPASQLAFQADRADSDAGTRLLGRSESDLGTGPALGGAWAGRRAVPARLVSSVAGA